MGLRHLVTGTVTELATARTAEGWVRGALGLGLLVGLAALVAELVDDGGA